MHWLRLKELFNQLDPVMNITGDQHGKCNYIPYFCHANQVQMTECLTFWCSPGWSQPYKAHYLDKYYQRNIWPNKTTNE